MQLFAQSREDLENKRYAIIKDIENTERELKNIRQSQQSKVAVLENLKTQVVQKKKLLETIDTETEFINEDIRILDTLSISQKNKLQELTREYGELLFSQYKSSLSTSKWALILDTRNLKDAIIKWKYISQIEEYLASKLNKIKELSVTFDESQKKIVAEKSLKDSLDSDRTQLSDEIKADINQIEKELSLLSEDERLLVARLDSQKIAREELNTAIQELIIRNFSAYDEVSRQLDRVNPFEQKRGFHAWPVRDARIHRRYGLEEYSETAATRINNYGIEIVSTTDNFVKSIAPGKLKEIQKKPDGSFLIIVEHEYNYYSVYYPLEEVFVPLNTSIPAQHVLGSLQSTDDGTFAMQLEIRNNKEALNPVQWLKNR